MKSGDAHPPLGTTAAPFAFFRGAASGDAPGVFGRAVAILLVVLTFSLAALAAAPDLHARIHPDRPSAAHDGDHPGHGCGSGHTCAINLFLHGCPILPQAAVLMPVAARIAAPAGFAVPASVAAPRLPRNAWPSSYAPPRNL